MSKEFETILDLCIDELREGKNLEAVLERYPEYADELRPLLKTASAVSELKTPEPSPQQINTALLEIGRRSAAGTAEEEHIPSHIPEGKSGPGIFPGFLQKRWLRTAVNAVLVVLVLFWGLSTVSADSVPGDVLYPVKRATEQVRFALTFGPADRAELRLTFSEKRLKELSELYRKTGDVDDQLIRAMLAEAERVIDKYAQEEDAPAYVVTKAQHLNNTQADFLNHIQPYVNESSRPVVNQAIETCRMRGQRMQQHMQRMMERMHRGHGMHRGEGMPMHRGKGIPMNRGDSGQMEEMQGGKENSR